MTAPAPGVGLATRVVARVRKMHALAVSGSTVHERDTALQLLLRQLDQHHPALRFCFPVGTPVRLLPQQAFGKVSARRLVCETVAKRAGAFTEAQRVTEPTIAAAAARKRYFAFARYGYYVFLPVSWVELRV